MNKRDITTMRCINCGKFMDCADPNAVCDYTPDSDRSVERIEWTCGPCRRAHRITSGEPGGLG